MAEPAHMTRVLSRRTGVPVKVLREYEDAGIYTVGRGDGNYRLFDYEALWGVEVIVFLAVLGVALAFEFAWYLARGSNALTRSAQ